MAEHVDDPAPSPLLIAQVLLFALVTALITEGLSYVLVYRTEAFQRLSGHIEKETKRVEKMKEDALINSIGNKKDKKVERAEQLLKQSNRDAQGLMFRSTIAVSVTMIVMYNVLSTLFAGVIVAKLPFEPFGLFTAVTHRNLPGTDMTDCAAFGIYALASVCVRETLKRYLGFAKKIKGQDFMDMFNQANAQASSSSS